MRQLLTGVCITAYLILLFISTQATATNSRAELEAVMADLLAWLPGEYSTQSQLDMERRLGKSPDGEHEARFRVFAEIKAPHIGEHIIYGQLHAGDHDGPIIPGTQVLYHVSVDEKHHAVTLNGRRIANGPDFVDIHLHPERQKDLELDPSTGGNCDFRWRRHGGQIVGLLANKDETNTDGNCTMVSKVSGQQMTWDAEWVLNDNELWIYDNGYLEDGTLFIGREDRTHERLSRVTWYDCEWEQGNRYVFGLLFVSSTSGNFTLHDGGGQVGLDADKNLSMLHSRWVTPAGLPESGTTLTLKEGGQVSNHHMQLGRPREITAPWGDLRVACLAKG